MAYQNFKQTIWASYIESELSKLTIFEKDCDFQFQGDVARGKTVKVLGVGRPTVGDYTGADIGAPKAVADSSVDIVIDQAKYFNFLVDDVDLAQSKDGLMQVLMREANTALAEQRDLYIAKSCATGAGKSVTANMTNSTEAKAAIDTAIEHLWTNGVTEASGAVMYLSPKIYRLMLEHIISVKTDNAAVLEGGLVGSYMGFKVKLSNNLYNDGSHTYIILKGSKGFAFAGGINEVEAYRPQGLFSDAVKGLNTYGGKVVRPREVYTIKYPETRP